MDDELVQKWRSGDVGAEATVRDHIRSIVAGVYSRPALFRALGPDSSLEFREAPTRSVLAEKTTREIMGIAEGGARQLEAVALMYALSHAIERLQALPERQRQSHLPPRVLCASVLSPAGLGRAMREAADRHLATCPHCRKDWELVRTIARETVQDVELGGEPKWADRVEPELRGTVAPAEERSSEPGAKLDFRGDGGTDAGRRFFTVWLMVAITPSFIIRLSRSPPLTAMR